MTTLDLFTAVQASPFSKHIGHLNHLFGATLELAHIAGMLLLLSSVVLVSLRLLGLGLRRTPLPEIARATAKLVWVGLGLLAVSGTLILIPAATSYYPNSFLWYKFILLGLALLVHLTLYRAITRSEYPNRLLAGFTGVFALSLWFGVAFAGRFIGFF